MHTKKMTLVVLGFGLAALSACVGAGDDAQGPERLDQLVITDPNFDFATTRTVQLELRAEDGAAPQAVEVADAEGRRLMDGAFRGSATIDLKVPVGRDGTLKLRVGKGVDAVERELDIDGDRRVVGSL